MERLRHISPVICLAVFTDGVSHDGRGSMKNWIAIVGTCAAIGGGALLTSCDRAAPEDDGETHVSFERYEASAEPTEPAPSAEPSAEPEEAEESSESGETHSPEPTPKTAKTEITVLGVERDDPDSEEGGASPTKQEKKVDIKKAVADDVNALRKKQRLQALPKGLSNIKQVPTNLDMDKLPVQKDQGSTDGQKK
jgi:hypothetical protein